MNLVRPAPVSKSVTPSDIPTAPQPDNLHWTVWPASPYPIAQGGQVFACSLEEFAEQVRQEHAERVYAKGTGPYFSPTKNINGHRCNKSTESVHALILDADGAGGPEVMAHHG